MSDTEVICVNSKTCISRLVSGCEHIRPHKITGESCCTGYCGIAETTSRCIEVR